MTTSEDGRRVPFDTPGRYTPLFALDEAVFLAAGHRPCGQCRRRAYDEFKRAWTAARGGPSGRSLSVTAIDEVLQAARLDAEGLGRTFRARLADLPDGTFFACAGDPMRDGLSATLIWRGAVYDWSHEGYGSARTIDAATEVDVLTPAPIVDALRAGYCPAVAL